MVPPRDINAIDPNLDEWVRHRTPSDSPPPSYSQATAAAHAGNSASEKMSLDFIAPGSCTTRHVNTRRTSSSLNCLSEPALIHRSSRISTPHSPVSMIFSSESGSNHFSTGYSARVPSPVFPLYAASTIRSQTQTIELGRQSPHHPASQAVNLPHKTQKAQPRHIQKRQTTPPPPYTSSQAAQRGERPGYCPEGRYAIIYLRGVLNYKWSEVIDRFNLLFPPGHASRCQIAGLPNTYPKRDVQGLQCRWYRIREEEGLTPLRDTQSDSEAMSPERRVLEKMVGEGKVSLRFVWLVEDMADLSV